MNIKLKKLHLFPALLLLLLGVLAVILFLPLDTNAFAVEPCPGPECNLDKSSIQNSPGDFAAALPCGPIDIGCWLLKAFNWLVDAVFALPFGIAEMFFSYTISLNFDFGQPQNPAFLAITVGYPIVLGIANMFFVLILLWIAIATIFSFEEYSARKLLPTLIISALLINFSLPIGRAFIDLSNGIAKIFYQQLIDSTDTKSLRGVIRDSFNAKALVQAVIQPSNNEFCKGKSREDCASAIFNHSVTFVASDGTREQTSATFCHVTKGRTGVPFSPDIQRQYKDFCDQIVLLATKEAGYNPSDKDSIYSALAKAIAAKVFIYPIAIFVLFATAILLLSRFITLTMVIIFAPAAFLMNILPATKSLSKMWWDKLMKQAFFLPSFMFLFFLSMQMVKSIPEKSYAIQFIGAETTNFGTAIAAYFVACAFLIGSLLISSQFGIAGSAMVNGWASKIGGALGGWAKAGAFLPARLAGRRALTKAGEVAHAVEGGRFADSKFARGLMKAPFMRRGFQNVVAAAREQIDEAQKQNARFSSKEQARRMKLFGTSKPVRSGMAENLMLARDTDDLIDKEPRLVQGIDEEGNPFEESDKYFRFRQNQAMIEARNREVDPIMIAAAKYAAAAGVDIVGYRRSMPHLSTQFDKTATEAGTWRAERGEHAPRFEPSELLRMDTMLLMFKNATSGWIKALEARGGTGATILKSAFDGTYAGVAPDQYPEFRRQLMGALATNTGVLRTLASKTTPGGIELKLTEDDKNFLIQSVKGTRDEQVVREIVRPEATGGTGG